MYMIILPRVCVTILFQHLELFWVHYQHFLCRYYRMSLSSNHILAPSHLSGGSRIQTNYVTNVDKNRHGRPARFCLHIFILRATLLMYINLLSRCTFPDINQNFTHDACSVLPCIPFT